MKLINFGEINIDKDIQISEEINFKYNVWRIQYSQSEHISLNFEKFSENNNVSNYKDLVILIKILTYYEFPKLFNLNITSWLTTNHRHSYFINVAKNFLLDSGFTSRKMLSNITLSQCKGYIEDCISLFKKRIPGSITKLDSAIYFFDRWSELSHKKRLPKEFRFEYDKYDILDKEKRAELRTLKDEQCDPWQPLDADIVKSVFDESLKYIQTLSPTIIKCSNLVKEKGRRDDGSSWGTIRKDGRTKHIFKVLENMKIPDIYDGVKLFNFKPVTKEVTSLGYASGKQDRTTIPTNEIRPAVIKLKRSCIFIIGLFTGLRRREIASLKAKPAYKKNDCLYLDIIRFKQAADSEQEGEEDSIPIPKIVGDAIDILIELFAISRKTLNSQYLLVTDMPSKKNFEKIKIDTITKDIRKIVADITDVTDAHPHQLRKTIAWLLISRSEKNIDLIRQLFGHKSYGMTLRYIMRNELMVESVIELLEHNYTEDLQEIFEAINNNNTAGDLSDKIKKRMEEQIYPGSILVTDIESYVRESLKAGIPLFVSRVPIGGFCINTGNEDSIPPCMMKTNSKRPCVDFCNYKVCDYLIFNDESISNIHSQINYYKQKLSYLDESSNEKVVTYYQKEILEHRELLERLENKKNNQNFKKAQL
ncbi:TPA: tyrosine-type recombinase/integrase [Vibrio vulnificus]|nr:tyrosine-type recombinase/integrase [Vibrio vulnificus]HDY8145958.1 tyrosine-type recombinase/integrase [Vibrio vulnificus]